MKSESSRDEWANAAQATSSSTVFGSLSCPVCVSPCRLLGCIYAASCLWYLQVDGCQTPPSAHLLCVVFPSRPLLSFSTSIDGEGKERAGGRERAGRIVGHSPQRIKTRINDASNTYRASEIRMVTECRNRFIFGGSPFFFPLPLPTHRPKAHARAYSVLGTSLSPLHPHVGFTWEVW